MPKRELKISDKKLLDNAEEDILLHSPPRIPDKGIQNALNLKQIQNHDIAYYDIALTENQAINADQTIIMNTLNGKLLFPGEGEQLMGEISDI